MGLWFHGNNRSPTVAWDPDHEPQWLFTTTPTGIAICYSIRELGKTGKHEHPYYLLHHPCNRPKHLTHTRSCRDLSPDTAYILHYIYSHLTQRQQE